MVFILYFLALKVNYSLELKLAYVLKKTLQFIALVGHNTFREIS